MPKFLFVYHGGGMPETPEAQQAAMDAWGAWYGSMGDKLVDGGAPVAQSYTVTADAVTQDGGANPASGFTIVEAASYDEACEMAQGCPMVADGSGSCEVAQMMEM